MKKSELRKLVLEVIGGYENRDGKLVPHSDKFDSTKLSSILMRIAKGRPEEGDPVRGNKILDKANPENIERILKGEKPIYEEGQDDLYSKERAVEYVKNNPNAKYYKIAVGKGVQQNFRGADQATKAIESSIIPQFELNTYGDVISFSAPFDEKHGAAVRAMGGLD